MRILIWPQAEDGKVHLTQAQLSMLLEGTDWKQPKRSCPPRLGPAGLCPIVRSNFRGYTVKLRLSCGYTFDLGIAMIFVTERDLVRLKIGGPAMSVISVVADYDFGDRVGVGVLCFSETNNFLYEKVYPSGVLEMLKRDGGLDFATHFRPS